jgi:release factor glutamine methyltransferase
MNPESIAALLKAARAQMAAQGTETAALDARLLLQAASGISLEELIANPASTLAPHAIARFEASIARRVNHEPVSRILGRRDFYGRSFTVTPDVLDPRADTETLITLALDLCPGPCRFVDLGTGSGAIAITLCRERADFAGVATDLSPAALVVAKQNAAALGVGDQLRFHHGAWFEGIAETFNLLISNPPYIRDDAALMPDVANYDPPLALFGGPDGLAAYRAIAKDAARFVTPHGLVLVEIGWGQADDVRSIFETQGFILAEQRNDLAATPRALGFKVNG